MYVARCFLLLGAAFFATAPCRAQLNWGSHGAGGSGSWDETSVDWYNGSSNTTWVDYDTATFGGTGGTVSIAPGGIGVGGITFNSAGYTINGYGLVDYRVDPLIITANANATIQTTIYDVTTLDKNGTGTLILSGLLGLTGNGNATVNINAGVLEATTGSPINSEIVYNLANTAGAELELGTPGLTYTMEGLTGGGTTGGNVMAGTSIGTSTLAIALGTTSYSYGGSLEDNGSGKLALLVQGNETLTGTNTYSGATEISNTLTLSGTGSIANSAVTVDGGILKINTSGVNGLSTTLPITVEGGVIEYTGSGGEGAGTLVLAESQSVVEASSSILTFAGVSRSTGAGTLDVLSGPVQIAGVSNTNGIVGAWAVEGASDWATVNGQNELVAYSSYATNLNTAATTANVSLNATGTTTLNSSSTINSLKIANTSSSAGETLDLGGHSLALTSGGLLFGTSEDSMTIQDGSLTSLAGELIVTMTNLTLPAEELVSANIVDSSSPVSLTITGGGNLYLSGVNTYSGATYLVGGLLEIVNPTALPSTTTLHFNGGSISFAAGGTVSGLLGSDGSLAVATGYSLAVNVAGDDAYAGLFNGGGGLTKTGAGTLELSNAENYTGTTQVNAGTLLLHEGEVTGGVAVLATTSPVVLAGGTLAFDTPVVGGITQKLGTLTLQSGSILDLANTLQFNLHFADSSATSWSGVLTIEGFNSSLDQVEFGTSASGLTAVQLSDIRFSGSNEAAALDSNGFLEEVQVAEPETEAELWLGFGLMVLVSVPRLRAFFGSDRCLRAY